MSRFEKDLGPDFGCTPEKSTSSRAPGKGQKKPARSASLLRSHHKNYWTSDSHASKFSTSVPACMMVCVQFSMSLQQSELRSIRVKITFQIPIVTYLPTVRSPHAHVGSEEIRRYWSPRGVMEQRKCFGKLICQSLAHQIISDVITYQMSVSVYSQSTRMSFP